MSLVHDALEKAKREASAQKARELGLPDTHAPSHPFRARKRAATIPIAIASLGTLAIVVAVYLLARDDAKDRANALPTPPVANAAATSGAPPAAIPAAIPIREPAAPIPDPASPSSAPPSEAPAPPSARAELPVPTPAPPPSRAPDTAVPTVARELKLDDGTHLRLGGIAWSEEAPLAYLNGKLLAKGESVAGFRIERIEKERVLLVRGSARYFVKL